MPALAKTEQSLLICRATALERMLMASIAIGAFGVLALGYWLEPDTRGFGTHEQLGLPPCVFHRVLGIPCPFCGMTTAFSLMEHGRLLDAVRTQPAGALACAATLPFAIALLALGVAGLKTPALVQPSIIRPASFGIAGVVVAAWMYTLAATWLHFR